MTSQCEPRLPSPPWFSSCIPTMLPQPKCFFATSVMVGLVRYLVRTPLIVAYCVNEVYVANPLYLSFQRLYNPLENPST